MRKGRCGVGMDLRLGNEALGLGPEVLWRAVPTLLLAWYVC